MNECHSRIFFDFVLAPFLEDSSFARADHRDTASKPSTSCLPLTPPELARSKVLEITMSMVRIRRTCGHVQCGLRGFGRDGHAVPRVCCMQYVLSLIRANMEILKFTSDYAKRFKNYHDQANGRQNTGYRQTMRPLEHRHVYDWNRTSAIF